MADRVTGVVKFFNSSKGYGFIACDNGRGDCYVRSSDLPNGKDIKPDQRVSFVFKSTIRGDRAVAVEIV